MNINYVKDFYIRSILKRVKSLIKAVMCERKIILILGFLIIVYLLDPFFYKNIFIVDIEKYRNVNLR